MGRRKIWMAAAAVMLGATAWPAAALAGGDTKVISTTGSGVNILETDDTRQSCTSPLIVQAFSSLADARDYVLAPGGSFEGKPLDGWQVQKAKIEGEGSPLEVGARREDNRQSLKIPAGGSALSPAMCVDLHYPIFRFMAKSEKGTGLLNVEVVYPDSSNPIFHPVGTLGAARKGWSATGDLPVYPERGGAAPGMRRVALRFTSVASGGSSTDWRIDDVYVDPRRL